MRISLNRIVEKAAALAAKTGDHELLELAELIHDLAEHVKAQQQTLEERAG